MTHQTHRYAVLLYDALRSATHNEAASSSQKNQPFWRQLQHVSHKTACALSLKNPFCWENGGKQYNAQVVKIEEIDDEINEGDENDFSNKFIILQIKRKFLTGAYTLSTILKTKEGLNVVDRKQHATIYKAAQSQLQQAESEQKKQHETASKISLFAPNRNDDFVNIIKHAMGAINSISSIYLDNPSMETVNNLDNFMKENFKKLEKKDIKIIHEAVHIIKSATAKLSEEYKNSNAFYQIKLTLEKLEALENKAAATQKKTL